MHTIEEIVADPYNWKFPKRSQLMSLQTINQKDVGFPKYEFSSIRTRNFDISDIDGAKTEVKGYKYFHKETFVNRKEDIDGTSPKKQVVYLNKPDLQLYNKDVKGSQPQINKFETTRQPFNPLQPVYVLPSAQIIKPIVPKFIRDSIQIEDIEGTKPNQRCFKTRNVDIYTEIEGSKQKKLFIPRDHKDFLDVKDINEFLQFITTRHTNPLDPTYITSNEKGEKIEFGHIEGCESRRLHPKESSKVNFNLTTNDIKGAWHGTNAEKFLKKETRKHFRQINLTQDIPEAQVGSLKKGIVTIRHVNPLVPKYQFLGEKEGMKNYEAYVNPIKEGSMVNASKAFKEQNRIQSNKSAKDLAVSNANTIVSQMQSKLQENEMQNKNMGRAVSLANINGKKRSSVQSQKSVASQEEKTPMNIHNLPKVLGSADILQQNDQEGKFKRNHADQTLSQVQKFDKFID